MSDVKNWAVVSDCTLLPLKRFADARGALVPIEGNRDLPFYPKRLFTITDVPEGADRGAHANLQSAEFIVAVEGSLCVDVYDGSEKRSFRLDRGDQGLFVPATLWIDLRNFAPGTMTLVLASHHYDGDQYIRDLATYDDLRKGHAK